MTYQFLEDIIGVFLPIIYKGGEIDMLPSKRTIQSFLIAKETHGNNKVWVVRQKGKFVTAFRTRNEASSWIYTKEK
ncbi:MAG: hypothetical protein NZ825_11915 [Candidatus Marinimicrobia bacterium]|nr:hypothetical protein [Candidatus Neomarinimicrobiota bacterium]